MSNLKKVTLSLQKIKSKNLGQNQVNLVHYLVMDYNFTNDEAETLTDHAVQTNVIRSVLSNEKTSYRIVKSDSFDDITILLPDTKADTEEDDIIANTTIHNETVDNLSTRETTTNIAADKHEVDDITTFIERKYNDLSQIMEKRLHKLEDQIVRMQNLNLLGNVTNNKPVTSESDLYTNLLKNRIIELENQLSEKNAIINYSTKQLIPKPYDKTICSCSHNNNHKTKINKDKDNDTQLEKRDSLNKVVIIGDTMLTNVNNCGLSKNKKK